MHIHKYKPTFKNTTYNSKEVKYIKCWKINTIMFDNDWIKLLKYYFWIND